MKRNCTVDYGKTDKIQKLARLLNKRIIGFDIETTGYKDKKIGVTEFAAIIFDANGECDRINTLINPGDLAFNPYAMKISHLSPRLLAGAPDYADQIGPFVLNNQDALWVGYNSNSCDLPILMKEHARLSIGAPVFPHRLDVLRLIKNLAHLNLSGSLSEVTAKINPTFVMDAHVALADVSMTIFTLEHVLSNCSYKNLIEFGVLPKKTCSVANT